MRRGFCTIVLHCDVVVSQKPHQGKQAVLRGRPLPGPSFA